MLVSFTEVSQKSKRAEKMILKEGGNIFKDPESGDPLTTRISRDAIDPTLDYVEKITGIDHKDMKLGSTGIKSSSGDIDVAVNAAEVNKEELFQKLVAWAKKNHPDDNPRLWVAKSGNNVHFRAPIGGNEANGFVQTDLMMGDPTFMKFALRGSGDGTPYKGSHRMIFIASIAKAQGMKWSPANGLVNRETNEPISKDPDEIAKTLIGPNASRADMDSVETINKAIKTRPDYNDLVADAKDNFQKQGLPMPESKGIFKGINLAESSIKQRLLEQPPTNAEKGKEKLKKGARGIANVFKAAGDAVKSGYAGFKAGQEFAKPTGDPVQLAKNVRGAYARAGGGKTTIGQVGDKVAQTKAAVAKNLGITKDKPADFTNKINPKGNTSKPGKGLTKKFMSVNNITPTAQFLDPNTKVKYAYNAKDKRWYPVGGDPKKFPPLDAKQGMKMYNNIATKTPANVREDVKKKIDENARIQHIEDLVYFEGSRGAMRALASLRSMAEGGLKNVTIKWDGSPAVIFGRNEDGEFTLTDKSGFQAKGYDGRPKSAKDLQSMFINRKQSKGKEVDDKDKAFASNMGSIFDTFEKAVPKDVNGYFKGDLLYYNTPPVKDKNFVFKPNPGGVEYAVDVDSDLGKRIAKSKTAVVIHRMVAPDGSESPLKDIGMFQGTDLLVVPPTSVEAPPEVPNDELDRLAQIIKKDSADLDSLLDKNKLRAMQLTNFADVLYNYVNQSVDRGTLNSLGKDFMKWLMNHPKISERKKQKIADYIKQNMNAFTSLWEVVQGIMNVKNNIISQLDSQGSSVKATTAGKPGGEGYVLAHPGGDMKLVNRAGFTAANRAVQR